MRDNDRIIELLANQQAANRKLLIDLATAEAHPETLRPIISFMCELEGVLMNNAEPLEAVGGLQIINSSPIHPSLELTHIGRLEQSVEKIDAALRAMERL